MGVGAAGDATEGGAEGGGDAGGDAQAAIATVTAPIKVRRARVNPFGGCVSGISSAAMEGLMWLLIEAGVALLLLVLIVWWTWPRARRGKDGDDNG